MKKRSLSIAILLIVILIVGIFTYKYLQYAEDFSTIDVYYLDTNTEGIQSVEKKYKYDNSEDTILREVYSIFIDSTQSTKSNFVTTKPENLEILDYTLDDTGLLNINFSESYREMTNIEEINFKSAFVWTFTDLDFVKKIRFNIDGYQYTLPDSTPVDYFDRTNVIVEPTIALDEQVQRKITLYFPKYFPEEDAIYLVPEERVATTEEGVAVEEVIVDELLKGSNEGNRAAIPSDVRVRTVSRENSICFIDLDEGFLKGNLSDREQKLRVYSLVDSLTELGNVDKVQILINTKKTKGFDAIDISKPIKRNEYFIKK